MVVSFNVFGHTVEFDIIGLFGDVLIIALFGFKVWLGVELIRFAVGAINFLIDYTRSL